MLWGEQLAVNHMTWQALHSHLDAVNTYVNTTVVSASPHVDSDIKILHKNFKKEHRVYDYIIGVEAFGLHISLCAGFAHTHFLHCAM